MDKSLDQEYLPSLRVGDTSTIFETWRARAAVSIRKAHRSDLRYGTHAREVLDFYPAQNARGCVAYIHGGYWMAFSKLETSWVVDGFLDKGISVALINYPLCPEVRIGDIRTSCAKAFNYLHRDVLSLVEGNNLVITGHSAGGYLAAAMVADEVKMKGMIALSGVFDVAPLMQTSLQENLQLDVAQSVALNLIATHPPSRKVSSIFAVGELESAEFRRQSVSQAKAWDGQLVVTVGAHHFSIVDDLASPLGQLNQLAVQMIES